MKVLVSLVGSNPLPIYTVCRYAAMENRSEEDKQVLPVPEKHLFVYTDNTKKYFDNMMDILDEKGIELNYEECNLEDKQHYGDEIIKSLDKALGKINNDKEIETIIINNTGGTKPMAVYSTIAILEFIKEQKRNIEELECYLDASSNLIRVNSISEKNMNASSNYCPKNGDLREMLTDIELSEILYMHRMEHDDNKKIKQKRYEELEDLKSGKLILERETLKEFAKVISKDENWKKYRELLEEIEAIKVATPKKQNVFEKMVKHMELTEEEISKIKNILCDKINIYNELTSSAKDRCSYLCKLVDKDENKWIKYALPIFNDESKFNSNKKASNFYTYVTGIWLEHYIHLGIEDAIKQLGMENKVKVYNSVVCRILDGESEPNFEVDLVLLKGYQIICFSCTTAGDESSYLLKSKAFEVLHRVEQLGGEHAKLVAVNMSSNCEKLENELKSFNSSFYKESRFITRNEIGEYSNLVNTLKDIIRK